jgi:hypothetical protein
MTVPGYVGKLETKRHRIQNAGSTGSWTRFLMQEQRPAEGGWRIMKPDKAAVSLSIEQQKPDRSGYRVDVHPVLAAYWAQEGKTDAEIAARLHKSRKTLWNWCKVHPELAAAMRFGKEEADGNVTMALYQQAVRGNVVAQIFWLCNRKPRSWKQKREVEPTATGEGLRIVIDGSLVPDTPTAAELAQDMQALVEEETPKRPDLNLSPRLPDYTPKKKEPEQIPTSCETCGWNIGNRCTDPRAYPSSQSGPLLEDDRERLCLCVKGGHT